MGSFDVDLVVVGAGLIRKLDTKLDSDTKHLLTICLPLGISGIAAARFYLEIHPQCRLVILEQDTCPGGVWNSRRSYEGFWTQWTVGTAEWSEMPMARPPEDDVYNEFFKAKHSTEYVEKYIDQHHFAGRSLRDRISFGFKVDTITKSGAVWLVTGNANTFRASKLIVASGLSSTPNMPNLPGEGQFEAPIIHQENFGQSSVLTSPQLQKVTVVGGGKSAADMVYACVKARKSVSWIIRASGTGPGFFLSPKGKGPYKNAFEIGSTRVASTLSPSILNPDTWWTRLIHGTTLGQKMAKFVWDSADRETREEADFDGRKNALAGFENLKPRAPLFWQNGTGGLLNRADFWDVVAPNVQVHLDDILELSQNLVRLKKGQEITTDALLCGTGWNAASFDFFSPNDKIDLGLPHPLATDPPEEKAIWTHLENTADQEILQQFPTLANPPPHPHKRIHTTPYRLYNGIAPLHADDYHSIAFVGYTTVSNFFKAAECQAIWATAFLDKQLTLSPSGEQQLEIARHIAWCKRRYLSNGERGNFIPFESGFYTDKLLREVGLSSHLSGGWGWGWVRDYFVPGTARDLAGLRDEYLGKYGGGDGGASSGRGGER